MAFCFTKKINVNENKILFLLDLYWKDCGFTWHCSRGRYKMVVRVWGGGIQLCVQHAANETQFAVMHRPRMFFSLYRFHGMIPSWWKQAYFDHVPANISWSIAADIFHRLWFNMKHGSGMTSWRLFKWIRCLRMASW